LVKALLQARQVSFCLFLAILTLSLLCCSLLTVQQLTAAHRQQLLAARPSAVTRCSLLSNCSLLSAQQLPAAHCSAAARCSPDRSCLLQLTASSCSLLSAQQLPAALRSPLSSCSPLCTAATAHFCCTFCLLIFCIKCYLEHSLPDPLHKGGEADMRPLSLL
jgi:hypothetical protein